MFQQTAPHNYKTVAIHYHCVTLELNAQRTGLTFINKWNECAKYKLSAETINVRPAINNDKQQNISLHNKTNISIYSYA